MKLNELKNIWLYFSDPRISLLERIFVPLFLLFYTLSPIDVIPDLIPVIGWLDDVGVWVGVAAFCGWRIQKVNEKEAKMKTVHEAETDSSVQQKKIPENFFKEAK